MKFKLTLKKQDQVLEIIILDHFPFLIGRTEANDLSLPEPHISRHHAKVEKEDEKLFLVNLSKTGRLLLNQKLIEKEEITLPVSFEIPPYSFELEVEAPLYEDLLPKETAVLEESEKEEEVFHSTLDFEEAISEETKITSKPAKAKMIILKGDSPYQSYDLIGEEIVIGRDSACDIVLEDAKASREHVKLFLKENHYYIKDCGSSNGTLLNHETIQTECKLSSGDQIQVGDTFLQFAVVDEEAYALSSVIRTTPLSPDATQAGVTPHWGPEVPAFYYGSTNFFTKYKKFIYASMGLILLILIFFTLNQKPTPKRETAQAKEPLVEEVKKEPNELSGLSQVDRDYVTSKMKEAKDLIKNRKYKEALVTVQEIFTVMPNYKNAKVLEVDIKTTLHQQEMEDQNRRALLEEKKLEEEIKYHLSVALDYFNRQQWQKAKDEYDKILELRPEHEEAQKRKGEIETKINQKLEPKPTVSLQKKRNQKAEKFLAEGSKYSQENQFEKALNVWRQVLKMEGINPEYYAKADKFISLTKETLSEKYLPLLTQANALIESKEYLQAQEILKSILNEYPSYTEAREVLGKVEESLHQVARREFTEAVIEENVGRLDEAQKRFKWIIERVPASDEYHQKAKKKLRKYE